MHFKNSEANDDTNEPKQTIFVIGRLEMLGIREILLGHLKH